jgi:predicted CoA-binding protein
MSPRYDGASDRDPAAEDIRRALRAGRTVAVVGLSDDPRRPSQDVARYLQQAGFRVVPVNPNVARVLGEKAYASLSDVPFPIDVVDVFRRSEHVSEIVDEAIRAGVKAIWLQLGVVDEAAAERARRAGIVVVMDRCLKVEHARSR